MINGWVVDTQLMVDWCLWALSDHAPGSIGEAATQQLSKLRLRPHRDSLERHLNPENVLLAGSVLVETALVLRRRLGRAQVQDASERINEPIVRATHRFMERFKVTFVKATEAEAAKCMNKLNRDALDSEKPIDFGDGALVATLSGERRLLTADERLFDRCVNIGRTDVFWFDKGIILDSRRETLRPR